MPKLALILAGAVSLGSYEGGVLDELLYLLDYLHRTDSPKRYTLDVVTGASAGSMTAALVARATMNNQAHRRALHDAWVSDIDIVDLIADTPGNALLSRDPIDRIAAKYVRLAATDEDKPAPFAPDILRMVFTISNLNGVDFTLPVRHTQKDRFTSTFFSDRRTFRMSRGNAMDADYWAGVQEAAIASGTFPIAFAPVGVRTAEEEYLGHGLEQLLNPFFFIDGGMFNNEPIREAVRLARESDGESIDSDRVFLLVDANLNGSTHDRLLNDQAKLPATAMRLMGMMRGEASASDWLRSQRTNSQLEWRDEFIDELAAMVSSNALENPQNFRDQLRAVAETIVQQKRDVFGAERYPPEYLDDALERTGRQHDELIAGSGLRADIFTHLIFVLNSISGLDKKSALNIDIIYADKSRTAGDQLANFGGFFDQEWREHDYRLGRQTAYSLLPDILGVSDYPREPGVEYFVDRDLSQATLADIPVAKRTQVLEAVLRKAEPIVRELAGGGAKGWAAWKFAAKGILASKLRGVFELDDPDDRSRRTGPRRI